MARIDVPEGDGGELVQVWSLSPELGAAVGHLRKAPLEADVAAVDLRDAHAGGLAYPDGEDALVVCGIHQPGRGRAQLWLQRPDLHRVATLAGWYLESGHTATLCQYSISARSRSD